VGIPVFLPPVMVSVEVAREDYVGAFGDVIVGEFVR
jgi:hypothetical protein